MRTAALVPAAGVLALLAASPVAGAGQPAGKLQVRDATGRDVTLSVPARRIVSLAPSVTETLFAIGADPLIVGVSKHCDYPVAAKLKQRVGDFNEPDLERVRAAAPEVVLFTEYAKPADLAALQGFGITGLVLPARSVADVVSSIATLGALSGRGEVADTLAAEIAAAVQRIDQRLAGLSADERPRVYVEVDGPESLYGVGPGSFMDDIVSLAGGRNVFSNRSAAYFAVAPEDVVKADPEVILIDYPFQYKAGLAKRPGWDAIAAVRQGRVYDGTDYDIILFNRPGPRIARALLEVSRLLHPGVFREP